MVMTFREAMLQALTEQGMSRDEAELRLKTSDGFLPDAVANTQCPVKPGQEREFIEQLKTVFRQLDANREGVQAMLRDKMGKRGKEN
jgi:hypothetical protein